MALTTSKPTNMAVPGPSDSYLDSFKIHIDQAMVEQLRFTHLPDYARFLYENRIQDLALEQYRLSLELKIPLLSHFADFSKTRLMDIGTQGLQKVLSALAANRAVEYIEQSVLNWKNNNIPQVTRNQVSLEDICMLSFIRCKLFRDALPSYTADQKLSIQLMEEVNAFTSVQDTLSFRILLRMQQELYEQAQQIAHIGNWSLELSSNAITWSNELYRIYELEPQTSLKGLASFNHPEDAEMVRREMAHSRETGEPHDFCYRILFPDGREKHLHALGRVQKNEKGEAEKIIGTLQDVSSLKLIEKEHQEKEYFIQKITELTPSIISVYEIKTGRFQFINQAFQTIMGYRPKDLLEAGAGFFLGILHPNDLPRILAEYRAAIETANQEDAANTQRIREFSFRMRHADGQWRWMHTFGAVFERGNNNEVETIINVSLDVTTQMTSDITIRQNAEEFRKQEDRYYKMIDEVQDYAILLLSTDGIIENWNTGAQKIKGYKSEEIIGKNFRIFYPPEDRQTNLPEKLILEASQKGRASHEGWRLRKDQTRFWGSIVITALHNKQGDVIGFSKVTRDLTHVKLAEDERRRYTQELERKNEELEQKNTELESFTYIASHDLQEPVRKIRIWTNRLEEKDDLSDDLKDSLGKIQNACVRMQRLIQGVLQYSQANMMQVPRELTDLDLVMDEVLLDFSEAIQEKQIVIERDHLPALYIVRLQFVQLFSNIISNAIRYSRSDLRPLIKITSELDVEEGAVSGEKNGFYKITISDNGIGFIQEYADKMFELFRRLESGPGHTGTGVGLAICKKIINNHQGTITAKGEPGKGASFIIKLPLM
jgi:PAS domain S-box-containing protein